MANKIMWYVAGVFVLAIITVFSWLAFDLQRRDRDILKLRAETENLGAQVARASVDRDVALAKCRVLEEAIKNARKRETTTHTSGRETTVTVSASGETTTITSEPSTSSTEIVSDPTVPGSPFITAPAGNTPYTVSPSPATVAGSTRANSISALYETDGALGIIYTRDIMRLRLGLGYNLKQRAVITAGFTF